MTPQEAAKLRAELRKLLRDPFPASMIGQKPQPLHKNADKGRCADCGGWHGLPAIHIDYVGHAAVTDRLLQIDPDWTFTIDAEYPGAGEGFGIRGTLTVLGVTRPEYGDGRNPKEAVSDFLKRAAMRFGVALDLWSKEELQASEATPAGTVQRAASDPGESTDGDTGPHPADSDAVASAGDPSGGAAPASPDHSAPVGQVADAAAPGPEDASDAYGEGATRTSEGPGAAPTFRPCPKCGGSEFVTRSTQHGPRQVCGSCGRAAVFAA